MNRIVDSINNEFKDCSDLITYKIKHGRDFIYVIYLETLSSAEHINNFIFVLMVMT